ncbi:MAG: hypothetical protein HY821_06715 [Acidobacteria bacterium]|nr:hypothetical protein [Acidobacteriota bacterium]
MLKAIQRFAWRSHGGKFLPSVALLQILAAHALFLFVLVPTASADDCSSDYRRAEDCLRTPGFAQTLGTTAGVIGTILINGVAVKTLILRPPGTGPAGEGGENQPDKQYFLDVRTQGSRTTLMADGKDTLWISAKVTCSDPKVDCSGITAGIGFSPGGMNADWLKSLAQDVSDYKSMQIAAAPPDPAQAGRTGQATMDVTAVCEGGYLTASVPLQLGSLQGEWDVTTEPKSPEPLIPDSKMQYWLYAKIKFDENAVDPTQLPAIKDETSGSIEFDSDSSGWVVVDKKGQPVDDYMAVLIQASNPSGNVGGKQGPESCAITIRGSFMGQPMQTSHVVKLMQRPEIDIDPEKVELLAGDTEAVDVSASLTAPGEAVWTWETEYEGNETPLATASIQDVKQGVVKVSLTPKEQEKKAAGSGQQSSWLTIKATCSLFEEPIKRAVHIFLIEEGLVVKNLNQDGTIHVRADGEKDVTKAQFELYAFDPATKKLIEDKTAIEDLEFTINEEPKSTPFNCAAYCVLEHQCGLVYSSTVPTASYEFWTQKALPGEDRVLVKYNVAAKGYEDDKFKKEITFTIEVMTAEEESEAKEIEYKRCREVIAKYIPAQFQQKFYTLVDEKKDKLGPRGLAALRRKIWKIAVNYILAEGDEAYKEMEKWADAIVTVLEYATAAGDIAFNAAATALCGPYGAMAAGFIKGAIVSAVQAAEEGQNICTWASQNLWTLYSIAEGQVIDVDVFEKALGGNRYKAWAYYVAMTFALKLYRQKEIDFYQAAKDTASDLAVEKFSSWLGQECSKSLGKHGIKYTGKGGDTVIVKPTGDGGDGGTVKPVDSPPKQPDAPPKQPDGPPKQPDGPPKQPDGPPKQPDAPPKQPDAPPKQPDAPPKQPEGPPKEPEGPPKEADGPPKQPDGPPKQPDGPPKQPDGPPRQPDGPPKQPDGPPKQPDGPPKQPDGPPKQPDLPGPPPPKKPVTDGESGAKKGPPKQPVAKAPEKPAGTKPPEPPKPEPPRDVREKAWTDGKKQGQELINKANQARFSGDPQKVRDTTLDMQGNKQAMYEINRQNSTQAKQTRQQIKNELKKIYDQTDTKTCKSLSDQLGTPVRKKDMTNKPGRGSPPKDPTKVSYDRDVTYERQAKPGEIIPNPDKPGDFIKATGGEWVDVPPKQSASVYNEHFKDTCLDGASPDTRAKYDKMSADEFAKKMDQSVTDRLSSDSYGRGQKDAKTALENPAGEFSDPSGVGKTATYKADEWYQKADTEAHTPAEREACVAEGMRQTTKQFGNQVNGRLDALNENRGFGTGSPKVEVPPKLQQGVDIMKGVENGTKSPAEAEAELAAAGLSKESVSRDLGDFMNKIYRMPVKP